MERTRTQTAYLLFAAGILHLVVLFFRAFDLTWILTALFGVAYLALGYYILRSGITIVIVTAAVTLIGAILSIAGIAMQMTLMNVVFLLLDLAILAGCAYMILKGRRYVRAIH